MPTAIRSQHFVLERLLKKIVCEGWPETLGRANAPIDTGSEQINRLSQGRLRTPSATKVAVRPPAVLGHRTGALPYPEPPRPSLRLLMLPVGLLWLGYAPPVRR